MEAALVFPIFVLLVFGAVEVGMSLMACNVLASAARHGARTGSVRGSTNTTVSTAMNNILSTAGITGTTTTIKVNGNTANVSSAVTGDEIRVTVSVPFSHVSPFAGSFVISQTAPISRTVIMRHE